MRWTELSSLFSKLIVEEIKAIPVSTTSIEGVLVWTGERIGTCTVKGAYNSMQTSAHQQNHNHASTSYHILKSLWQNIWNLNIMPKINFFRWRVYLNSLPTRESLHKRKITPEPLCPVYHQVLETIEHLFLLSKSILQAMEFLQWIDGSWTLCYKEQIYLHPSSSPRFCGEYGWPEIALSFGNGNHVQAQ